MNDPFEKDWKNICTSIDEVACSKPPKVFHMPDEIIADPIGQGQVLSLGGAKGEWRGKLIDGWGNASGGPFVNKGIKVAPDTSVQKLEVDPMWDRYFELAFNKAFSLYERVGLKDLSREPMVISDWAATMADKMVAERNKRAK